MDYSIIIKLFLGGVSYKIFLLNVNNKRLMNNKEKTTKLLIAGHFGAGKTTFVKTASQIKTVETERKTTLEEEKSKKQSTTVAMDYGEYQTEDG